MESNLILIGPPGVGKSTVGVLLAKALSMPFVDTDIIIQASEGRRLQEILDAEGIDAFRALEAEYILRLDLQGHVIATGGSVVYSRPAMEHLRHMGDLVLLMLPCDTLIERIHNLDTRGVVLQASQTFCDMYDERAPLYREYADLEIDCGGLSHEQVVARVVDWVETRCAKRWQL